MECALRWGSVRFHPHQIGEWEVADKEMTGWHLYHTLWRSRPEPRCRGFQLSNRMPGPERFHLQTYHPSESCEGLQHLNYRREILTLFCVQNDFHLTASSAGSINHGFSRGWPIDSVVNWVVDYSITAFIAAHKLPHLWCQSGIPLYPFPWCGKEYRGVIGFPSMGRLCLQGRGIGRDFENWRGTCRGYLGFCRSLLSKECYCQRNSNGQDDNHYDR